MEFYAWLHFKILRQNLSVSTIKCFRKKLHPRCSAEFSIRLCLPKGGTISLGTNLHLILPLHTLLPWTDIANQRDKDDKNAVLGGTLNELGAIKDYVITNIYDNIKEQCNKESADYRWFTFDLNNRCSVDEKFRELRELCHSTLRKRMHEVAKYSNAKETKVIPVLRQCFKKSFIIFPKSNLLWLHHGK